MKERASKWRDPGIFMVAVLVLVAAIVLVWWPKDTYVMGISLAGWLMFLSYFAWFGISVAYVLWIENIEKRQEEERINQEKEKRA